MSDEPIYCGNAKLKEGKYGTEVKILMHRTDVEELLSSMEGDDFVNITADPRKTPSAKGYTHYLKINTWKPKEDDKEPDAPAKEEPRTEQPGDEEAPF